MNVKREIEPGLFRETVKLFNLAAATGINDAVDAGTAMPDDDFLTAIKTSNEVFSAFRVHRMQNDIAARMTDENGQLKSFSRFARDVKPYTDHQNRNWLKTEYNTAVLRAHQAADWQQFEREKDIFPNLEWEQSTSPNPGADHISFWGTVLPIDDPFWDQHRPGDRWNCKCGLRNTDKDVTKVPTANSKFDKPAPGLENNPGKDGKLFSNKHSYMPDNCGTCPFGKGKLWALARGVQQNCSECGDLEKAVDKTKKARQEYNAFDEKKYEKTCFDDKSGGYVVTERQRIVAANKNKQESAKYKKEKNMCLTFAKGGNKMIHLGETSRISSADTLCNGIYADLKRTGSPDQVVAHAKKAIHKQNAKLVLFQFDKWNAKFATAIKEMQKLKIHGKYFITGKENEIIDF